MRRWLLVALLALIPGAVYAQRMSSGPHFSGRGAPFRSPHYSERPGAYILPFFDPSFANYAAPPEYPAAQPPVIVVQPQSAPAATVTSPPVQPLTIELRGDRFVQISGDKESNEQVIDEVGLSASQESAKPTAQNIVLIFRDGHHEAVSNYTVADGFVYAGSDFYTAGAWVRKIAISELNIPETMAVNQAQGAAFRLPKAANEVVVGP